MVNVLQLYNVHVAREDSNTMTRMKDILDPSSVGFRRHHVNVLLLNISYATKFTVVLVRSGYGRTSSTAVTVPVLPSMKAPTGTKFSKYYCRLINIRTVIMTVLNTGTNTSRTAVF